MDILKKGAQQFSIDISEQQLSSFQIYSTELMLWNSIMNLTAIRNEPDIENKHFLDSISIVPVISDLIANNRPVSVIDIGSGAGFPGMPLKILFPHIDLTLVESNGKKVSFLHHVSGKLGFDDVVIYHQRAEILAHEESMREKFDLILSRAVAELRVLSEITLPFCKLGGRVVLHKGSDVDREMEESTYSINLMGGRISHIENIQLSRLNIDRSAVVIEKNQISPIQYPRRPGMPSKKPLGSF